MRLSGHAQTNDRLAIKEMGRQIAEAEGIKEIANDEEEEEDDAASRCFGWFFRLANEQEYAPTTLPSHLLALLTAPSPRAIIIVMEEFDLFTEHARQALLYCLCQSPFGRRRLMLISSGRCAKCEDGSSRINGSRSCCDRCYFSSCEFYVFVRIFIRL